MENFPKVLVIGDTILDHYIYGAVDRINPEAPHSVVLDYMSESVKLGGATNVANNLVKLTNGQVRVHYYGAVSEQIVDLLTENGIHSPADVTHDDSEILLKTRFVCDNHHILRVDRNKNYLFKSNFETDLYDKIEAYEYDLIILSDYNKGTLNQWMVNKLWSTNLPILFDVKVGRNIPRPTAFNRKNNNVILKCNRKEFLNEISVENIQSVQAVVETRGSEGFRIHNEESYTYQNKNFVSNVVDVVGAGDTFLAGMAARYLDSKNWDVKDMAYHGNLCASEKVKHFGTYAVKKEELV